MSCRIRVLPLVFVAAAGSMGSPLHPALLAQQSTGAIEGRVTDVENGRPLAGARITVAGTTLRAVTSDAGAFRLNAVPARQVDVQIRIIGFAPATKTVTVTAGQTARLEVQLAVSALQLDQIVVTGSGQQVEAKKLGNTVAVIQPREDTPVNDLGVLLQAKEPGLSSITSAGLTGSGARIRIRGNASLTQSNEPILFLDGIRMNGGGGQTSRLEDIDPESIERVEVLKGAAAATLYGTEASNGVIQVFTKRGSNSAPKWHFSLQQEAIEFPDRVAPNAGYARTQAQADSVARYWQLSSLQPFQVFEIPIWQRYFTETGKASTVAGQVDGGGTAFTYFASGRYQYEDGPIGGKQFGPASDQLRRVQSMVNLSLLPFNNLHLGLHSAYYNTWNAIPGGGIIGNSIYGTFALASYARPETANCNASSELAPADCSGPGNAVGNQAFMTARESMQQIQEEAVQRYAGIVSATYTPLTELNVDVNGGWDVANTSGFSFSRFHYDVDGYTTNNVEGSRSVSSDQTRVLTLDAKAAWNRDIRPGLSSALVGGLQVFNVRTNSSGGSSTNLPGPGIEVVSAGGQNIAVTEGLLTTINGGFFAQEQLGFHNWTFLTVGGRRDYASAFGAQAPGTFYPKASVSIVPSDRTSWTAPVGLNTLRLRFAWGKSGRQPGAFDKFTTFAPLRGELGAGLVPSNLGNPALRPEVATEVEGGFEAGVWHDRVGVNATAWNRVVNDLLIARQFPVSGGFRRTQLDNIGQVKAHGYEFGARAFAVNRPNLVIDLTANASYIKQTLTSLGGAPTIKTNAGYIRDRVYLKEGDPLGSVYAPRLATACPNGGTTPATNSANQPIACYGPDEFPISLNGNGRAATRAELLAYLSQPRDLKTSAVQNALRPLLADYDGSGDVTQQRLGSIFPDWTGTFGPTVTYRKNWRLQGLFEWRTGFLVHNLTYAFRNSQHATIGSNLKPYAEVEAILDNPASTPEQRLAAADTYIRNNRHLLEPGLNEFEKGDFLRFREIDLTYHAPDRLAARLGARSMAITLGGRNLALWTPYSGADPEIAYAGREAGGGTQGNFDDSNDAFGMPIPRRFSVLINLTY